MYWNALKATVEQNVPAAVSKKLRKWIRDNELMVLQQCELRALHPGMPRSTGGIENQLTAVRSALAIRKFSLRNRPRLAKVLELMRIEMAHKARPEQFALLVRQRLEELRHGPIDWRRHWDPMVVDEFGKRRPANSLIAHRQLARERSVLVNDDRERDSSAARRRERVARAENENQAAGGLSPTIPRRESPRAVVARAGQTVADIPNMLRFWDYDNNERAPGMVRAQSMTPVAWICRAHETGDPDGRWAGHLHQWTQTPSSRARADAGCPFCMRQKACAGSCLRATHPMLASREEWDYATNDPTGHTPDNVLLGSKWAVSWLCGRHGPYMMVIQYRAKRGQGCKPCAFEKMTQRRHETINRVRRERHALAVEVRARRAAEDPPAP